MRHFLKAPIAAIFLSVFIGISVHAQGMGAYYWGDADGNGDIGTPDVTSLTAILNNPAASDTVYYTKFPVSRYRQDTDGNGDIGAPDATILRAWLYGDFSTISGGAATLVLEATTTLVLLGNSVLIGAHALSGSGSLALRTGFGVEFAIDATSPCQTAEIYGYTVKGGDTTAGYGWYHQAYKYTPQPFAPDFAKAWVKVRPTGCSMGQHIYIKVFIPSDAHAVIPGARFPNELAATSLVDITVRLCCMPLVSLAETPNPITIAELGTQQLRVVATLIDSSTVDCTTSCLGNPTTYTSTGNVSVNSTGLVTGSHVPGCAGGAGTVTAHNNGISSPDDVVTVTNDETVIGMAMRPPSATIPTGGFVQLYAVASLSDGTTTVCNSNCCGGFTTWNQTGICLFNGSLVTAPNVPGCGGPYFCTFSATNNTHTGNSTITVVNNNTVSSIVIAPSSATIAELGTVQINATATLSDASTAACNTYCCGTATTWTPTGNVTVSAGGLVTGSHVPGCAGGAGTIRATNNGHTSNVSTITVTNDETVSSVVVTPNPGTVMVGGHLQMHAMGNVSDGATADCTTACCGNNSTWVSGNVSKFTVTSPGGYITGVAMGMTVVVATNNSHAGTSTIAVSCCPPLISLAITPNPITIAELGTQQVRVVATLTDSSTVNCTTSCLGHATTYTNVTGNITVSATGLVTGTAVLKCAGGAGTFTATNTAIVSPVDNVTVNNDETVSSVAILPITATIAELATVQLNATATLSDGSTNACNTGCCGTTTTWTPTGNCSVNASGLVAGSTVKGCAGGSCTVTATANAHVSNVSTITITNDDTITSVVVTPNPGVVEIGGNLQMHLMGNVSDGATADCTTGCCGGPTSWIPGNVSRFTVSATGLITGISPGTTIVTAFNNGHAGTSTITVSSCGGCQTCVVSSWFPFNASARIYNNAHANQGMTLLYNNTLSPICNPTSAHITCHPTTGPNVVYTTCSGYPDANCSPTSSFAPLTTYGCTATVTNAFGSTTLALATMHTGTAAAPSLPAVGGIGGGYVGGDSYSRTIGCANGSVTLRFIDMDTQATVNGKVYVQIAQGATVTQAFAPAGIATVSVPCLPITDLTAGLKCSTTRCDLNTKANNYNNYEYSTWTNIDGKDMVLRMMLMPNSAGYINTYNTVRAGRYRADVFATIPYTNFSQFIAPLNRADVTMPRAERLTAKPTHLRAGLALFANRNVYTLASLISDLMDAGDSETSISICIATQAGPGTLKIVEQVALPPNLVLPELVRSNWSTPCSTFAANPGVTQFHAWNWIPGQTLPLMVIGAYQNMSNLYLTSLSNGFDLYFPLYVSGVGYHQIPELASWTAPTADLEIHEGNLGFEIDMREVWVQGDFNSPGYDPDIPVDKRIMVSVQPILPIDPARRDAGVGDLTGWNSGYHVPNITDNQLITKWGTSYGLDVGADGASWDDRFVRNSAIFASGAFTGFNTGIALFGLQLNDKIDDANFTTFEVGYMSTTMMGTHGWKIGTSNWMYWSGAAHSERFGREMTFVPSNTTQGADDLVPWSQPIENGGPVNYATLVALVRGLSIVSPKVTPMRTDGTDNTGENMGLHSSPSTYSEGGVSLRVQHVGPIQSWTTTITSTATTKAIFIERLLGLPEAISPTKDSYFYPAPQWSATPVFGYSLPINRNGELRQVFTYSTAGAGSSKIIQRGAYLNRRYLKFSVPLFVPNWTGHTPDLFLTSLATNGQGKSAKAGAHDSDGTETTGTPNTLTDNDARFIEWGVATGDNLWLRRGGTGYGPFAISARTQTTVSFTGSSFGNGRTYIKYHIRRAHPRGECLVDEWYGGGSYNRDGGGCNGVSLWQAMGPIPAGAASVTVSIPNITPGPATFNAVSGTVPDFWEGIPSDPRWNNAWYHPPKLSWSISVLNINSAGATQAGLGGKLDWNNMNFWATDFAIIHLGADTVAAYLDIRN